MHFDLSNSYAFKRSDLHETTTIKGQTVKDPGGFHATISIRGEEHIKDNTFLSVHAYTRGKNDFTLRHASRAAQPLALTTTGRAGKLIWPANLTEEETFFVDPPEESASAPEEHATGQEGSRTGQEVSTTTQASDTGVQMTANSSCTAP